MPYFLNHKGNEIYYEVLNAEKSLLPLVFLHGYGSSLSMFANQIPFFQKYFKLILFDSVGHGKSKKSENEIHEDLINNTVENLEHLLELLEIEGDLGILGHSLLGNCVGQKFITIHPDRVKFFIILNGGSLILDSTIKNIFWNLLPQFTRMHFQEIVLTSLNVMLQKTIPFIRGAIADSLLAQSSEEELDEKIIDEINEIVDDELDLSTISCPSLIIGAELDNFAPAYMSKELRKKIKNSELNIVSMTGHFGLSQRYCEYNKIIKKFLLKHHFIEDEYNQEM